MKKRMYKIIFKSGKIGKMKSEENLAYMKKFRTRFNNIVATKKGIKKITLMRVRKK